MKRVHGQQQMVHAAVGQARNDSFDPVWIPGEKTVCDNLPFCDAETSRCFVDRANRLRIKQRFSAKGHHSRNVVTGADFSYSISGSGLVDMFRAALMIAFRAVPAVARACRCYNKLDLFQFL